MSGLLMVQTFRRTRLPWERRMQSWVRRGWCSRCAAFGAPAKERLRGSSQRYQPFHSFAAGDSNLNSTPKSVRSAVSKASSACVFPISQPSRKSW